MNERMREFLRHASKPSSQTMCLGGHMAMLHYLQLHSSGVTVELGVGSGTSALALLHGIESFGGQLYSVDIDPASFVRAERLTGELGERMSRDGQWEYAIMDATEAANRYAGNPVGLLFQDTSHRYDETVRELAAWIPRMGPQGILCGHDLYERHEGRLPVLDAVTEIQSRFEPRFDRATFIHDMGFWVLFPRSA